MKNSPYKFDVSNRAPSIVIKRKLEDSSFVSIKKQKTLNSFDSNTEEEPKKVILIKPSESEDITPTISFDPGNHFLSPISPATKNQSNNNENHIEQTQQFDFEKQSPNLKNTDKKFLDPSNIPQKSKKISPKKMTSSDEEVDQTLDFNFESNKKEQHKQVKINALDTSNSSTEEDKDKNKAFKPKTLHFSPSNEYQIHDDDISFPSDSPKKPPELPIKKEKN